MNNNLKIHNQIYGKDIELIVEQLSIFNTSKLDKYDCGNEQINDHIKRIEQFNSKERPFLVINTKNNDVIAFFSLRATSLVLGDVENAKEGIMLCPAVEIVTFALDINYQDMWMSDDKNEGCLSNNILSYIIKNYINAINQKYCAVEYIVLYSVKSAVNFYKKNFFFPFGKFMIKSRDPYTKKCTPMYFDLKKYNEIEIKSK